jgi:Tfp pilus assembly protein PilN
MRGGRIEFSPALARRWFGIQPSLASKTYALLALLLCTLGCAWLTWTTTTLAAQVGREREQSDWLHTRIAGLQARMQKPRIVLPKEQILEFNRITRHLNTPWANIFAVLERHVPAEVALIAIEPDAYRRTVRITAESRSLDDLMAYAADLRQDAAVSRVSPLEHDTATQQPAAPLRMVLELSFEEPQ